MIEDQQMQRHAAARRPEGRRKDAGVEPGLECGAEALLRIEAPGYGRAVLRAVVPAEALEEIEAGDRPVDADLKIRVPGYGWHTVGARVAPRGEESSTGKARPARMRVPGYGGSKATMTFPRRASQGD